MTTGVTPTAVPEAQVIHLDVPAQDPGPLPRAAALALLPPQVVPLEVEQYSAELHLLVRRVADLEAEVAELRSAATGRPPAPVSR